MRARMLDEPSKLPMSQDIVIVTGPSGSGKTTVIDLAAGLLHADEGRILIDGQPINEIDHHQWRRMIEGAHQRTAFEQVGRLGEVLGVDHPAPQPVAALAVAEELDVGLLDRPAGEPALIRELAVRQERFQDVELQHLG